MEPQPQPQPRPAVVKDVTQPNPTHPAPLPLPQQKQLKGKGPSPSINPSSRTHGPGPASQIDIRFVLRTAHALRRQLVSNHIPNPTMEIKSRILRRGTEQKHTIRKRGIVATRKSPIQASNRQTERPPRPAEPNWRESQEHQ